VFAAVLVPAGKLGDLYGRRRLFSIVLFLVVAGSAIAAVAGSLGILIAARAVQAMRARSGDPELPRTGAGRCSRPSVDPGVIAAWGAVTLSTPSFTTRR
jgi:MFS family permease